MRKISFFILLISFSVNAACNKPVTYLIETTPAPCTGYLFTPEKEQENRLKLEESKLYKELSEVTIEENGILNQRLELYQKHNKELQEQARKNEFANDLTKVLYFILGATAVYLGGRAID